MKKKYLLLSGIALSTAGVTSYVLRNEHQRTKAKQLVLDGKEKVMALLSKEGKNDFPIHQAGQPEPEDIRSNEMLSEGSVYPVDYYNAQQQK
ncbi:hypothetical protein A374_14620 [Fictibacillus macauensis ZFHKF-1]|uniref:YbyB n=1 Tax=Fictibacillus macauensis ZFHKF-1 TaxID=1196324 RepID=I8UCD6_9BACL|nr:hypothetical protein [Fictibacillus macauensis]EIT84570.1 hypothetical protein A374_14620 [Fictibacillus macauensis ZFHKF-1]